MQVTTTDIIATLRTVVNKNTKLYKEDFKQDIKIFREAAKNPDTPEEKRTFLWLSRPMGTYCVPEKLLSKEHKATPSGRFIERVTARKQKVQSLMLLL